ncbi:hypothetical protein L5I01_17375 [Gordonia sp. HY442]|uniref:hypothetical protein n=1 Tax=Gordonia zhenghanii TaxID=2911516 RepID=UPI001F1FEBDF|nr:hypothetical protein [Gordonia zhenghanii]MCF8605128.1 hypothetical protein [Gordonia zhenghanii]
MTKYDDNDVPVEHHQAPDDIPKASRPIFDEDPTMARVKIVGGMSEYPLQDPPRIGEPRAYIVKAFCKKHEYDEVDGERRLVVTMEHTSIYEKGKVPIVDEKNGEPGLFDADNGVMEGEGEDTGADEGSAWAGNPEFSES